MKFKAEKTKLSEAIANASKACALKTAYNALDGVLLNLSGDILTVTGYDLEMGIKTTIRVEGTEDGEIVADARLFGDMIRRMPADAPVEITVKDEKDINVKSGKIRFNLQGTSGNNFPNILELNDNVSFKIKESSLKNMLSQVYHAIAQTDINPALMGAKFTVTDKTLYIVTSDGVRLALRKEYIDYEDITFILPEKTVLELNRNLSEEKTDSDVTVIIDRNQACISRENYMIFSRLLEGKFIDYQRITGFTPQREAIVNVREMIGSLERSLLLITDKFKSPVICTFESENNNSVMHISCKTNLGTIEEDHFVKYKELGTDEEGKENEKSSFSIAFNPKFMFDALKNSNCDEVKLLFLSELSPIKIVPLSEEGFLFVVVPVRLK